MKKRKTNNAKRISNHCKNNGSCDYCRESRLYQARKQEAVVLTQVSELPKDVEDFLIKGLLDE